MIFVHIFYLKYLNTCFAVKKHYKLPKQKAQVNFTLTYFYTCVRVFLFWYQLANSLFHVFGVLNSFFGKYHKSPVLWLGLLVLLTFAIIKNYCFFKHSVAFYYQNSLLLHIQKMSLLFQGNNIENKIISLPLFRNIVQAQLSSN